MRTAPSVKVTVEELLRMNIKELTQDLCKSFVRNKKLSDRVKELENRLINYEGETNA